MNDLGLKLAGKDGNLEARSIYADTISAAVEDKTRCKVPKCLYSRAVPTVSTVLRC